MSGPNGEPIPTVTELLLARRGDERPGLRFEDREWTWDEHLREIAEHAALLRGICPHDRPFHVGVLLDNLPETVTLLGAAAWSGAVISGINPTRRGSALARDVRHTDCALVITERRYAGLLEGLDLNGARVLVVDSPEWRTLIDQYRGHRPEPVPARPDDLLMLVFTSGTSGEPKAVRCTHGKIAFPGRMLADRFELGEDDGVYIAMPLFHSNAVLAGWSVGLAAGATLALRRRFSATGFLADVRRFNATYANYVGKPLAHVLRTQAREDDARNPLRLVYGNEGSEDDRTRFAERFDCHVVDGFGSTEGGIAIQQTERTPSGSLGIPVEGVAVLDPETGRGCPVARFDEHGRLSNPEAIGELVNTSGAGWFAGYYRDPDADANRMRDGMYWSGDLAYLDAEGFCYFAGRSGDWLRVDGENLGTAPIERTLGRHPGIAEVAVYAVPDPVAGDRVMAAIEPSDDGFDPNELGEFLASQDDLGPKQWPSYVRVTKTLPRTSTFKVLKRQLANEGTAVTDPVFARADRSRDFRATTEPEAEAGASDGTEAGSGTRRGPQ